MTTPQTLAEDAFKPLQALSRLRGGQAELIRQLDKMGYKVSRSQVSQWLHPDPARRVMPALDTGLMLIEAGKRAAAKLNNPS